MSEEAVGKRPDKFSGTGNWSRFVKENNNANGDIRVETMIVAGNTMNKKLQPNTAENRGETPRPAAPVRIKINKCHAYTDSDAMEVLRPMLEYETRAFSGNGSGGCSVRPVQQKLYQAGKRGRFRFPAGLVPRIVGHLEDLGYRVEIDDRSSWLQIDRADLAIMEFPGLASDDKDFLAAISTNPRGQIILRHKRDMSRYIALLGRIYALENVQVITKDNRSAETLLQGLQKIATRPVGRYTTTRLGTVPGFCVGTWFDFDGCNWEYWQVTVFADVESAVAKRSVETATRTDPLLLSHSLLFGFIPADQQFDRETRLRLETIVGPEIFRLDDELPYDTQVHVLYTGPYAYAAYMPKTALERKRFYIWKNDQRNRAIGDIARAFTNRDKDALRKLGAWSIGVEELLRCSEAAPSVAILVEVPEHGQELRKSLKEWELLVANDGEGEDKQPELPAMTDFGMNRAIVTLTRANRAGVAADVIIRADGTESTWGEDYGPYCFLNGLHMVVVDVADDFDHRAGEITRRRYRHYAERGWPTAATGRVPNGRDAKTVPSARRSG